MRQCILKSLQIAALILLCNIGGTSILLGQTSISKSVFSNGAINSTGGNVQLQGTIGQAIAGFQTGGNTLNNGGFWSLRSAACDSVVTNLNDSGPGSLRDAISCSVTGDTITFAVSGSIILTSGEISITEGLVIDAGSNSIILDAQDNSRIFNINSPDEVIIKNVIFQRGNAVDFGGAIFGLSAVSMINCNFNNNQADNGGAIAIAGGSVNIINCSIGFNNARVNSGGGIFLQDAESQIVNTVFAENTANQFGGAALLSNTQTKTITNCTFFGNFAGNAGGAIIGDDMTIQNSIFLNNTASNQFPDIFANAGTVTPQNIVLQDISGSGLTPGVNNVVELDALLIDPIGFNYGLQPFSPAHGNADPALLPIDTYDADNDGDTNERIDFDFFGDPRGSTSGCNFDLGAFETAQGSLTVINNNDSGIGSLRSHMECTENNPDINFISFAIPGTGPHVISLQTELPFINGDNLTIDGTSQAGFAVDTPQVILDGNGGFGSIFAISADNVSILGIGMRNVNNRAFFAGDCEFLTLSLNTISNEIGQDQVALFNVSNSSIFNNKIGIDPIDGAITSLVRPVLWFSNCSDMRIEGNTLAGPAGAILMGLVGGSSNNEIISNFIGTNQAEDQSFGGALGILVADNTTDNLLFQNTIANNQIGISIRENAQRANASENNFVCNTSAGIDIEAGSNGDLAAPLIEVSSLSLISGTALPDAVIELYVLDTVKCINPNSCEGRFLDFTSADANGAWSFTNLGLAEGTTITAIQITTNNGASPFAICTSIACDITADAQGGSISCTNPTVQLQGSSNQPGVSFSWTGPNGFTSSEQNPEVSAAGTYNLSVSDQGGCTAEASTTVTLDTQKPDLAGSGGRIDCNNPSIMLTASTATPNVSFSWFGPGGFTSTEQNPEVSLPGPYFVTATGINGCDSTIQVNVIDDPQAIPVAGFDFAINNLTVSLTDTSTGSPDSWTWDFGNGQVSRLQNPEVTYPSGGPKTITLIVSNKCGADTISGVIEFPLPPDAVNLIFPEKTEGGIGDTLEIPVLVTNFESIASLQLSIHTGDENIATIIGVTEFNLPDLNTDDFNLVDSTTLSMAWFFGSAATLPDSAEIFKVQVLLTGQTEICTPIFIDDDPVFVEVGVLDTDINSIVSAPYDLVAGEVCILPLANIFGRVYRENQQGIADVNITGTPLDPTVTDIDGNYSFLELMAGQDYTVKPNRNTNPLDGVTAIDLALIQRHILQLQFLDSPYKIIAADVDISNTVGAIDLANIQRLILGKTDGFPNGIESWRFVEAAFSFPDPNNPLGSSFPEDITIPNLRNDVTDADFIGMKLGDVNGTAQGRGIVGELAVLITEEVKDGIHTIRFSAAKDQLISAYQFEMHFDFTQMQLVDLETGSLPGLNLGNFGMQQIQDGIISTLWYDPQGSIEGYPIEEGTCLFNLKFKAIANLAPIADRIWSAQQQIPAYGYTPAGDELEIKLQYATKKDEVEAIIDQTLRMGAISPNPMYNTAIVPFHLPKAAMVHFEIRDALGRINKVITQNYQSGDHQLKLSSTDLGAPGWYTVKMQSGNYSQVKRVILQR